MLGVNKEWGHGSTAHRKFSLIGVRPMGNFSSCLEEFNSWLIKVAFKGIKLSRSIFVLSQLCNEEVMDHFLHLVR